MNTVLLIHAASTWAMVGLIWFVQIVHYPLYARVGVEGFIHYQAAHTRLTTWVVGPLMLTELGTATWLALPARSPVQPGLAWLGIGLILVIWLSTAILQVPCHRKLERGFDGTTAVRLVRTNWLRTAAWSARGGIALVMLMPA